MSKVWYSGNMHRSAVEHGLHGVASTDDGFYTCFECGHCWQRSKRYAWWPIRARIVEPGALLSMHSVEMPSDRIEQRVYARVVRLWRVLLIFGRA